MVEFQSLNFEICLILVMLGVCRDNAWQSLFCLGIVLRPTGAKVSRLAEFQAVEAEICLILVVPGVCWEFAGTRHGKVFLRGLCIMLRAIEA